MFLLLVEEDCGLTTAAWEHACASPPKITRHSHSSRDAYQLTKTSRWINRMNSGYIRFSASPAVHEQYIALLHMMRTIQNILALLLK